MELVDRLFGEESSEMNFPVMMGMDACITIFIYVMILCRLLSLCGFGSVSMR